MMTSTPRVWIVQEPLRMGEHGVPVPRINYGTLAPFGQVKFLFSWGEINDQTDLSHTGQYLARARDQLRDFRDTDYLLPLGHPGLIALATLAAAEANEGRVKLLDWSRVLRDYRIVHVDLDDAR